jgi:hypothetical protein
MKLSSLVGSLLCLFVFASVVSAQSISVSGNIRGTVMDASGAVLSGTVVAATDPKTGFHRAAVTNSTGQYHLSGLPPATYDVTAQLSSFSTGVRKGVGVAIGQTVPSPY